MPRPPQSQSASGLPEPLKELPDDVIIANRSPNTSDVGYRLGQLWINKQNATGFILTQVLGVATWINLGSPGSPLNTINLVAPVANNIDLINQGGNSAIVVTAPGSGGAGTVGLGVNVDGVTITIVGDQLVASGGIRQDGVDTFTGPGTDPVLPTAGGLVTITGGQVGAGTVNPDVIQTHSYNPNEYTIEIQRSSTAAVSTVGLNGVSHFDSTNFTVDGNGFVTITGTLGGTATTVGAVTADVITFPMPVVADVTTFDIFIAGFNVTDTLGVGYEIFGTVRTTGGAAVLVGVPDKIANEEGGSVAADANLVVSGNNAIVRVTGIAGKTINWRAALRSVTV